MSSAQLLSTMVRVQLARMNKTQEELAKEIGMNPTSFSRLMVGKREWTVKILDQIAEPLGFKSAADLFTQAAASQHLAA